MMLSGATAEEKVANNELATLLLQHGAKADADFKHVFPDAALCGRLHHLHLSESGDLEWRRNS
jgi:hypothetical protein